MATGGRLLPDFPPVSEPNPESFLSISTEVVHLSLSLWITIVELPLELELKVNNLGQSFRVVIKERYTQKTDLF